MDDRIIKRALDEIGAETDPTLKSQLLASLCTALFREAGYELVVVGGSAIEFYTEGAYVSGDLDLCLLPPPATIPLARRQQLLGRLQAEGGPRSWKVAGQFVDLLGPAEIVGRSPLRQLEGRYGPIRLIDPEELLVERVLVAFQPQPNAEARACARQLLAVTLAGAVELDWQEVRRLAESADYDIFPQLCELPREVADELQTDNPFDPA